ncbi:MAG: universal stress protein [Nitrospiraceae bacterium]|nr:MAG: universal stress protein [Nitrospiraceae bacterium]
MKKVLLNVDETKGSKRVLASFRNVIGHAEEIILLHVAQPEGRTLMTAMLGEPEMSALRESLQGTELMETMNTKAEKILAYYKTELESSGQDNIKTFIRTGNPVDEILKVADEEDVDMLVLGCNGRKWYQKLVAGCVAKDVEKMAKVPVLIAKALGCEKSDFVLEEAYAAR